MILILKQVFYHIVKTRPTSNKIPANGCKYVLLNRKQYGYEQDGNFA